MNQAAPLWIRCDAGGDHGLGHLMRCLALADALRAAGGPVAHFIMQAPSTIQQRVLDAGFTVEGSGQQAGEDAALLAERLNALAAPGQGTPWLVLDGKYVTAEQAARLAPLCHLICYDDEPYRDLPAAVIINAQPWTRATDYPARSDRLVCAGAAYSAINPAYFAAAEQPGRDHLVITLGGEDPANDTAWIAEHLGDLLQPYPVVAVIGPAHPAPEAACQALGQHIPHADILHAPPSLVAVAERSFLALSAGGTSCYEFQAAGIATAAIAVEDHQIGFVRALEDLGGVVFMGGPAPRDPAPARACVKRLLTDAAWRAERVKRGRALFPAPGGPLLARTLLEHFS